MIAKRQEEYPDVPKPNLITVEAASRHHRLTKVKFFPSRTPSRTRWVFSIETKYGNVVITGDLKLDHENGIPTEKEAEGLGRPRQGQQSLLHWRLDERRARRLLYPGEARHQTLEDIVKTVSGRLIIGTFASQFERMIRIIEIAEKLGKKIVTEGRSIKTTSRSREDGPLTR
jgi:ribonuclease J